MISQSIILGAGATGLAVGLESGLPVYESSSAPGGICSSCYVSRNGKTVTRTRNPDQNDYRFELGGGHWLFGGDDETLRFIESIAPTKSYVRKSSVWFPESKSFVPFPVQFHLSHLPNQIKEKAFQELLSARNGDAKSLKEHLDNRFGPTLSSIFFEPFHRAYTAGLFDRIAPQDDYKSPVDLELVQKGYRGENVFAGYNVEFRYPKDGLGTLFLRIAKKCDVQYSHRVTAIDLNSKTVRFSNGNTVRYESIISTLPLSSMAGLTGLGVTEKPDPYTSVLVVNIGGIRGSLCPPDHWVYIPDSPSGFYRIGFYSNVDRDFLPSSVRDQNYVSMYAEQAFVGGTILGMEDINHMCESVVDELVSWGFLEKAEVVHPTWVDVAYTWSIHGSSWREDLLRLLESHSIHQVGRYARWQFQGITESIRSGREIGKRLRERVA
jgi:protoporphyrinogen oxidase